LKGGARTWKTALENVEAASIELNISRRERENV
jgi:hypothetical protein